MDKLIGPYLIEVGARNEKDPGGVTGFVLVAQSHLSLHTFPRRRFVSADVFTCQDYLDHEWIRQSLITTFGLGGVESNLIPRGTGYPLANLSASRRATSRIPDESPGGHLIESLSSTAVYMPAKRGADFRLFAPVLDPA